MGTPPPTCMPHSVLHVRRMVRVVTFLAFATSGLLPLMHVVVVELIRPTTQQHAVLGLLSYGAALCKLPLPHNH
eukprot:SAG11_NODE_50_length_19992_cov_9.945157_9_plen_74_part_00